MSTRRFYKSLSPLQGHFGPILDLSVHVTAKIVASAGQDGTRLFSLASFSEMARPMMNSTRGASTAVCWAQDQDDAGLILLYGTELGHLVLWGSATKTKIYFEEVACYRLPKPSEVTDLNFDKFTRRVAVGNRDGIVQVHLLQSGGQLLPIFSVEIDQFLPKSVMFMPQGENDILVTGEYCGNVHRLEGTTGKWLGNYSTGTMIGNAIISAGSILYDDPAAGAVVTSFEGHILKKRLFKLDPTKSISKCPRQVSFADDDTKIVIGTNEAKVVIFDRATNGKFDEIRRWYSAYCSKTFSDAHESLILAANARQSDHSNDIMVWQRHHGPASSTVPSVKSGVSFGFVANVLAAFLSQNFFENTLCVLFVACTLLASGPSALSTPPLKSPSKSTLFEAVDFYTSLTRACFKELGQVLFSSILGPVEKIFRNSKIDQSNVHEVVFVDGSPYSPYH
ncbi:WD40-repeat-containing domain protein [Flagelloscypha sp. PMI_526]|nr:WD40-repeat-containing domain protein [Flagelloscypha sp. PMI_526]